jgi:hypothetical protein
MRIGEPARRAGNEVGGACPESVAVYRRKLAEIDADIRTP